MNKRREPVTPRVEKKAKKEVRKAMREGDTPDRKSVKVAKIEFVSEKKHHKKVSKRSSPKDKIINSEPVHAHTENEHWDSCIRSQNLLRASRLRKKLSKTPATKLRMG
jgi:hypothetical protein